MIIGCRNLDLANKARDRIVELTDNTNVVVKYLDFNSLKTIKDFARDILETEDRLDVLVNNIGATELTGITEDGIPVMLQVNYYGHVLLTMLLLGK